MSTPNLTLADQSLAHVINELDPRVLLAVLGSAVVAVAAHVSVPMLPVPMTLQTLAVLAIGAAYGSRLGAATLALYALEGAIGFPVFSPIFTLAILPTGEIIATGGYIIGFILAAGLVGCSLEKRLGCKCPEHGAAMLIGAAILYVPGLIWLAAWLGILQGHGCHFGRDHSLDERHGAVHSGDIIKAVLAALAFPPLSRCSAAIA